MNVAKHSKAVAPLILGAWFAILFISWAFTSAPKDNDPAERLANAPAADLKFDQDSEACQTCNALLNKGSDFLLIKGEGEIFLQTKNVELLLQLINNSNDGFAVELIDPALYQCNSELYTTMPSRRNGQSETNGKWLKAVYQKDLIKSMALEEADDFRKVQVLAQTGGLPVGKLWRLSLGRLPYKDERKEANLVIIQEGKVCRVMHLRQPCDVVDVRVTLEDFDQNILMDIIPKDWDPNLVPEYVDKQETFIIPFEKGRYDYQLSDIKPLMDTLTYDNFEINAIDVLAYSSLEGSEKVNHELQMKRAENIVKAIKSAQEREVFSNIHAQPNWDLFAYQVQKYDDLVDFRGLGHEEVKDKLKNRELALSIEPYLSAQRRAEVTIEIRAPLKGSNLERFLSVRFAELNQELKVILQRDGVGFKEVLAKRDEIEGLQYAAYNFMLQGKVRPHVLDGVTFNNRKVMDRLRQNQLWMKIRFDSTYWNNLDGLKAEFLRLQRVVFAPDTDPAWRFNYLALYTRFTKDAVPEWAEPPERAESLLRFNTRVRVDRQRVETLKLHFYNRFLGYFHANGWDAQRQQGVNFLFKHYQQMRRLDIETVNQVARLLENFQEYDRSLALIKPRVKDGSATPEIERLYARLAYKHEEEFPDHDYFYWMSGYIATTTADQWCKQLGRSCGIPWQVLDRDEIREKYCARCGK